MDESSPTWQRLEDQILWYDRKSQSAQFWYKLLQIISILTAAAVPVVAPWAPWQVAAILGSCAAAVQAMQGLGQYQHNWITYRSTCESLKHEKYLYLAGADLYGVTANPDVRLAERIEQIVSQENAKWVTAQVKTGAHPHAHGGDS